MSDAATSLNPTDEREAFEEWFATAFPHPKESPANHQAIFNDLMAEWRTTEYKTWRGWQAARAQDTQLLRETLEALKRIHAGAGSNSNYRECGCEDHTSPDCCNNTSYCCPECISGAAITAAEKSLIATEKRTWRKP